MLNQGHSRGSSLYCCRMNEKALLAEHYKASGYNCAVSVLLAYQQELGMDKEAINKLGMPFGVGMGAQKATCGALIAAGMVLGMLNKSGPTIAKSRQLILGFEQNSGATCCEDLKGVKTGVVLCPCNRCVTNAVTLLEELLAE